MEYLTEIQEAYYQLLQVIQAYETAFRILFALVAINLFLTAVIMFVLSRIEKKFDYLYQIAPDNDK